MVHTSSSNVVTRWCAAGGYAGGAFGINVATWPVSALLMYFLTDTLGVSVAAATALITLPKLWDMLFDPIAGDWAERWSARRGNRALLLLITSLLIVAVDVLVFFLPVGAGFWLLGVLAAGLLIKSIAYMTFLISHLALADDVGRTGVARRDMMLGMRVIGQACGGLCAAALGPWLIVRFGGGSAGYAAMAAGLAMLATLFLLLQAMQARRYSCAKPQARAVPAGLGSALRAAMRDRVVTGLVACHCMVCIATGAVSTFLPYANKIFFRLDDSAMSVLYSSIMAGMVAGAGLAAAATKRYPRVTALRCAAGVMLAAALLLYAVSTQGALHAAAAVLALWGIGLGAYALLVYSSMMDVALEAAGISSGLLLGLLVSVGKIADAIGGVAAGGMLSLGSYHPGQAALDAAVHALRVGFAAVPVVAMLLGLLCLFFCRRAPVPRPMPLPVQVESI